MNKSIIIISIFFYLGCGTSKNQENSELIESNKIIQDTIKEIVQDTVQKEKMPEISALDSPLGLSIETGYGSSADIYNFFQDSVIILIFEDFVDNWWIGKWYMEGDSIIMNFHKSVHQRGIGEPIYSDGIIDAGGPHEKFEEYVTDINFIERAFNESWVEFKSGLNKGFHKLIDWNIKYQPEKYDLELNGQFPFASYRNLKRNDLSNYTKKELRLIRNEIFARYGLRFKSQDLYEHFINEYWYKPFRENVDLFLSEIEKQNIKLIQELENEN